MLRRFSRMQRSHVHTRTPRSTPADHVSGGGSDAATAAHVLQVVAGEPCAGTGGTVGAAAGDVFSVTPPA